MKQDETYILLPLLGQGYTAVDVGSVKFRLGRQARSVESLLPRDLCNLFLDIFIAVGIEEVEESLLELKRVETLAGPGLEVMRDELVKVLTSYELLEIPQEMEALLIRHSAEGVFGIHALVADDEFGELVLSTQEFYSVLCQVCQLCAC